MDLKNHIIIIGRQYGSGGRVLGKKIAEKLNIPYYDKEILTEASRKLGFDPDIFQNADEKKPGFARNFLSAIYGNSSYDTTQSSMSPEKIYEAQSKVIKAIATKSPCVIVGRSADYILRDAPNLVSIYVHANVNHRAKRVLERNEAQNLSEAISLCNKKDKERSKYYSYFTGRKWGAAENYDLSVDSSKIEIDLLTEFVLEFIRKKR